MASQSSEPKQTHERLVHTAQPRARLQSLGVQSRLLPDAPEVERFTTAHAVIFERHTTSAGVETWWKVERG